MKDIGREHWIRRVDDLVTGMHDQGVNDADLMFMATYFVARAARQTEHPLLTYELIIELLMGAAEDERQTSPKHQPSLWG